METIQSNAANNKIENQKIYPIEVWENPLKNNSVNLDAYLLCEFNLDLIAYIFAEKALIILDFLPKVEMELILTHHQFEKLNNLFFIVSDEVENDSLFNLIEMKGGSILKLNPYISDEHKKNFLEKTFYSLGVKKIKVMKEYYGI